MLDIYSIGDIDYLVTILNSIAAWAGTSNPGKLAAVGGMIGVFVICGQSIISGGKAPQFQNFLVAIIFYWFLMGPGVGVTVNDVYSGNTQNVANVPLGVAVIGSVMSSVGYTITEQMEQMFSTPKMTSCFSGTSTTPECGFLSGVRHMGHPAIDLYLPGVNSLPAAQQGNFRKTLLNYVQDCTYTGLSLDQTQISSIMTDSNPWAALGFASDIYGTKTYIPMVDPLVGTDRTCSEAYTQITAYLSGTNFWDHIRDHIKATFGIEGDPYIVGQDELDNMTTHTGTAAENIYSVYLAKILNPLFAEGINAEELMKYNMSSGDLTAAQAVAQRNEQWYGDRRLFQTTIRPALTFFEGLFYALTPFMAIMVMIVPFGIKMIIRYLQTAVWIQCWMPMMSVVNLYAYMAYYGEFSALKTAAVSASSLYGVVAVQSSANEWIAQANLLGSMVPALAMLVVYGTSVVLTHMAGQLRGGDHYDESLRAPSVVKNAPIFNYDHVHGMHRFGAPSVAPKINVGDETSTAISSAESERESSTLAYNSAVASTLSNGASHTLSGTEMTAVGRQIAASSNYSSQYVTRVARAINESMGGNDETLHNMSAALAAGGGWTTGVQARAQISSVYGEQSADRVAEAVSAAHEAAGTENVSAGLAESIAHDHRNSQSSVLATTVGQTEDRRLQEAASRMVASEESYTALQQARTKLGADFSNDIVTMARKVTTRGYNAAVESAAIAHGITNNSHQFQQKFRQYQSDYGMGREEAAAAARLMSLEEKSAQGNVGAGNTLLGIVAGLEGVSLSNLLGSPSANAGVGAGAVEAGNNAYDAAGGVTGPTQGIDVDKTRDGATAVPDGNVVGAAYDRFTDQAQQRGSEWMAGVATAGAAMMVGRMQERLEDRNLAEASYSQFNKRFGALANGIDGTSVALEHLENNPLNPVGAIRALRSGLTAAGDMFDKAANLGYQTPEGQKYAAEGARLLEEQQQAWQQMQDGGLLDKASGAYGWATAGVAGFFNKISAATESGKLGDVLTAGPKAVGEQYSAAWDNITDGMAQVGKNFFDADTIRAKALEDARHAGLVGEQADLYADVRTSALTFNHSPGYNPAEQARSNDWNLDNLKEHEWQRDENGNRMMNDTVARTIIHAAATGVSGNLNLVNGYNKAQ